ncbi:MAG: NAD(P)H-dependent glycerol-3-phosphate dehydrogenase [Bacilli bacterium]|jgi:glycerol-3-phosphate dehydrogenase (NAD(P)+)
MKVLVIGTGTWGTALGQTLIDNGHDVLLYGNDQKQIDDININHQNQYYFGKDVQLPINLKATNDIAEALDGRSVVILSVPTTAFRSVLQQIKTVVKTKKIYVNTAKGLEKNTNNRMSEIFYEEMPEKYAYPLVSLLGPSHAEEVIKRLLTAITATSHDLRISRKIQKLFSNQYFRVYTNKDEIGAELGAALKNAIAIASGILAGCGYGDNARAALITRGLKEMVDFATYFGAQRSTFMGLSGIGDLVVTCTSLHSRNFTAGFKIGQNDEAATFLAENKMTVEGIKTVEVVYHIAQNIKLEMPIINAIYAVLFENVKPSKIIFQLMFRPLKDENPQA